MTKTASTSIKQSLFNSGLVVRSSVPEKRPYSEYKPYLRRDFVYSCAYCTMTEAEARGIRFTIDHYEPRGTADINVDDYENLMYCCDECNLRKGNRRPPPSARQSGFRFFRPDLDLFDDHFKQTGPMVEEVSPTGFYTKEALDLNRQTLQRVREYRRRLSECDRSVAEGVVGLARVHIDRLPKDVRAQALKAIRSATSVAGRLGEEIDELLGNYAKSELLDQDETAAARTRGRLQNLKSLEAIHPGTWRTPRKVEK